MRKLIGVIAVLGLLVVAFSAPTGAQAGHPFICSQHTVFSQPSGKPEAYTMNWEANHHQVIVNGSVAATFSIAPGPSMDGPCPVFLSGTVTVRVKRPDGAVRQRVQAFENLEFVNGYVEHGAWGGKRFKFPFTLTYSRDLLKVGTCFTVVARWESWRYGNNELVDGDTSKVIRSQQCIVAQ